jgi:hypothetical protein
MVKHCVPVDLRAGPNSQKRPWPNRFGQGRFGICGYLRKPLHHAVYFFIWIVAAIPYIQNNVFKNLSTSFF